MRLEEFAEFLDYCGIRFKDRPKAFVLQDCPACGSDRYKVYLYKDEDKGWKNLYGKCVKCETKFTSFSYLIDMGQDLDEVKELHNTGEAAPEDLGSLEILADVTSGKEKREEVYSPTIHSIDHLTPINVRPNSPPSVYAMKRGVTPDLYEYIMVDRRADAVAFLCIENGKIVGYQYRYVNPFNPDMKTWNPPTFKKSHHIIDYPNHGDILICEGPFTAVAAYHYGFHGVCTFGSAISKHQIKKIAELSKRLDKRIAVSYDLDAAGLGGYFKIKMAMKSEGIDVYRVRPEVGNDLNDSYQKGKGYVIVDKDEEDYTIPVLHFKPFSEGYKS